MNNKELKKVNATINIYIMLDCPYCGEVVDLMDFQDLKDDSYLYSQLLGDSFGKENWNEVIECPDCHENFIVGNVEW